MDSKNRKDTKIANIKLTGKADNYLHVVIRYQTIFAKALGKKNYIVTFYGAKNPKSN